MAQAAPAAAKYGATKERAEASQNPVNARVALVTGSSSGIGFETSLALARSGWFTFASMRSLAKGDELRRIAAREGIPLTVIALDVRTDSSVIKAIRSIQKSKGRLDLLVNNAGFLLFGSFEDTSMEELKSQFETNFFGIARLTGAVLPLMRRQKRGVIINVSSVAGKVGIPLSSAYTSAEFAIEGLSESMRYELEPFGIHVCLVEPGMVRSNFLRSVIVARKARKPTSPHYKLTRKLVNSMKQMTQLGIDPKEAAEVILKAAESKVPQPRYVVGNDAAMVFETRKTMPDAEFENFVKTTILGI